MRKTYTGLPLKKSPSAFPGGDTLWIPMLRIRCMYQHKLMKASIMAVVDSGAPYCVFRMEIADYLGIDLTNAPIGSIGGVISGPEEATYFHRVKLQIENNWTIEVTGAFMKKLSVPAILGRNGFFDRFLVTFDHSKNPHEFEITKIERPNLTALDKILP